MLLQHTIYLVKRQQRQPAKLVWLGRHLINWNQSASRHSESQTAMMEKHELSKFSMRFVFKNKQTNKTRKWRSVFFIPGDRRRTFHKRTNEMFSITLDPYGMHNYTQQLHRLILGFFCARSMSTNLMCFSMETLLTLHNLNS